MLSLPRALLSWLLLSSSFLLLLSCSTPPDVIGCTAFAAADWPAFRDKFYSLCAQDPACAPNLPSWQAKVATWTMPSDSGACITWMTQAVYQIDATHPLPANISSTGQPKSWTDLAAEGVILPAKESYAPEKTFLQSFCHNNSACGAAGNWQGTIQATDQQLTVQSAKLSAVKGKK